MKHPEMVLTRVPSSDADVRLDSLYTPLLRRWRFVATCIVVAWLAALAFILVPKRKYTAQLVLAPVPNTKSASLAGGLSSLLGNAMLGGVQSTPYFISRLLQLDGVLREVALSPAGDSTKRTVIEAVLGERAAEITPKDLLQGMNDIVDTDVDKQTGLVTLSVTYTDSALARRVAQGVLASASKTFGKVLRAQASDQRVSGQEQIDSTRRLLREAEVRLQSFQTTHRVYQPYSPAAVERARLDRELTNAQSAYADAVSDQQNAVARELTETPAVVVVDPIAPVLVPVSRQAVLKLLLASVLGMVAAGVVLAMRGEFVAQSVRGPLEVSSAA